MTEHHGFFGKLPARGDFVSAGLPRDFVTRWDAWLCNVLPTALAVAGDSWMDAPVWRFRLPSAICGADPVTGLLFPSTDKVGRQFPLTLAWLGVSISHEALAAAEELGRSAIAEAIAPAELAERLAQIPRDPDSPEPQPTFGQWWQTDGVAPLLLPTLPDGGTFVSMIVGTYDDR